MLWDDNYTIPEKDKPKDDEPTWHQQICHHDWKAILLITSTVHDCTKCKVKKEEYEAWRKRRNLF